MLNFAKHPDTSPNLDEVRKMFEDSGWCSGDSSSNNQIPEPPAHSDTMFNHLSVAEYQAKMSGGWEPFLIDVRSSLEYSQIKVSSTNLQVPHEEILSKQDLIPRNKDIILLCRSGMRSQVAAMYLLNAGFSGARLFNLDGGIIAWRKQLPGDIE
tara:strand:- start:479 stop:940 length:462 start_codon:yes stop_codon:yes gene_type:complete